MNGPSKQLVDFHETFRLSLNAEYDTIYLRCQIPENVNGWLTSEEFSFVNYYLQGKCEIYLRMASLFGAGKFDLIFTMIPLTKMERCIFEEKGRGLNCHLMDVRTQPQQILMLIGSGHFVEGPEFMIASGLKVRIERPQVKDQIWVDGRAFALNCALQINNTFSKGEIDAVRIGPSEADGSASNGLIEGMTQIIYNSIREQFDLGTDTLENAGIYDLLSGLVIEIRNDFVAARLDEGGARRFKIEKAFFSAVD